MTGGLLLAIANPKAFAAIGAVYAGIAVVPGQSHGRRRLEDRACSSPSSSSSTRAWLALGASFSRLLRRPRIGRAANIGFAVLLVLSVAAAALH